MNPSDIIPPTTDVDTSSADVPFDWDQAVQQWRTNKAGRKRAPAIAGSLIRQDVARGIKCLLKHQDQFSKPHIKELLGILIWKYTEADGKYSTSRVSERALEILNSDIPNAAKYKQLCHEHVWERDLIIETLLAQPQQVDEILKSVIACVVTREEAAALNLTTHEVHAGDRWERYTHAGIKWRDMQG